MPSKKLQRAGVSGERFDRRVRAIKRSGSAMNPYAVATASFNREIGSKRKVKSKREVSAKR